VKSPGMDSHWRRSRGGGVHPGGAGGRHWRGKRAPRPRRRPGLRARSTFAVAGEVGPRRLPVRSFGRARIPGSFLDSHELGVRGGPGPLARGSDGRCWRSSGGRGLVANRALGDDGPPRLASLRLLAATSAARAGAPSGGFFFFVGVIQRGGTSSQNIVIYPGFAQASAEISAKPLPRARGPTWGPPD